MDLIDNTRAPGLMATPFLVPRRLLVALLAVSSPALADSEVPPDLQVALLKKVVRFERHFDDRTGGELQVLVVVRRGDGSSERAAGQLGKALEGIREIAGKPIKVSVIRYSSPGSVRTAVLGAGAKLVCFTPGLEADIAGIAGALVGVPAITVGADGADVDLGAVLGFELVSARAKIVVNVGQARRQGLDFNSDLFRLARVVR
jgi:uncharacterized protein DUF4154